MDRKRKVVFALRIIFSMAALLSAILLVALWIRSYSWGEELFWKKKAPDWYAVGIYSGAGRVGVTVHHPDVGGIPGIHYMGPWNLKLKWRTIWQHTDLRILHLWGFGAGWKFKDQQFVVTLPHWFVAVLALISARAVWMKWRFSLRMLLAMTALIAVATAILAVSVRTTPRPV